MTKYNFQAEINKFDPCTTRYTGENALFLADCANLVYVPEASIEQVMKDQLKFVNFKFFDGKSTQAFMAGNDKMIVISFRGTQTKIGDFLADSKLRTEDGPVGKVHRGFQAALHEVWGDSLGDEDMRKFIKQFQDNKQSIWFCGHSLTAIKLRKEVKNER